MMSPLPYKGFVEGSIFITKVGGFDCGFYLSQQLKELIYRIGQKFGGRKVWRKCVKYQFGE